MKLTQLQQKATPFCLSQPGVRAKSKFSASEHFIQTDFDRVKQMSECKTSM